MRRIFGVRTIEKSIDEILKNIPKIYFITMITLIMFHIAFLILLYGYDHDHVFGLSNLFDLDDEGNFPTWFSTINLFTSSLLLYIIYRVTYESNPDKFWIFLSIIFIYLSMDEMIRLHERMIPPLRNEFHLEGYFYFGWVIVGIAIAVLVGLLSIPFLRRLPKKVAIYFLIAGAIYVFGVIGMEMFSAKQGFIAAETSTNRGYLARGLLYGVYATIEETLEMSGILFFNYTLVRYLQFIIKNKEEF